MAIELSGSFPCCKFKTVKMIQPKEFGYKLLRDAEIVACPLAI